MQDPGGVVEPSRESITLLVFNLKSYFQEFYRRTRELIEFAEGLSARQAKMA